jgi:foldase protein PrsA
MNKKLKKQIEEAMIAEWNIKESYNDDLYGELEYQDFINNLGGHGMHIEYIPVESNEDMKDLAKEYSDDSTTASEGGLLSGFSKADVVEEFWNASTDLKDGKYTTSPVKSSYGYFVILRVSQDEKPSLEDSKDEVLSGLVKDLETADSDITTKAWVDIRKSYNLNIVDSDIKKAYETTIASSKK